MTDTPRTDDRVLYAEEIGVNSNHSEWVNAPFARGLERELKAANKRIKRMEREIELLRQYSDYTDVILVDSILRKERND